MNDESTTTPPPVPNSTPVSAPSAARPESPKAPAPAPVREKSKRPGCGPATIIILLGIALAGSVLINLVLMVAASFGAASQMPDHETDEYPVFTEQIAWGTDDGKRVALIELQGVIARESTGGGLFPSRFDQIELVTRQIRAARNDHSVSAILLEVNSPGGALTPTDEIYDELLRFKKAVPGRKIVVFMRDLAASGGYYAAMASDWIIAQPTTIVGSIGVIMPSYNMKGLGDKIGIADGSIKSGKNKDLFNPFLDPASEAYAGQKKILQDMVDLSYERFLDIVAEGRGIEKETIRPLADGRIFNAPVAKDHGLIDEIGYFEDAVEATRTQLETRDIKVFRYHAPNSFMDLLSAVQAPPLTFEVSAPFEAATRLGSGQLPLPVAR